MGRSVRTFVRLEPGVSDLLHEELTGRSVTRGPNGTSRRRGQGLDDSPQAIYVHGLFDGTGSSGALFSIGTSLLQEIARTKATASARSSDCKSAPGSTGLVGV